MVTCSIDGCEQVHFGRGWCSTHYTRWRRHGDPLLTKHRNEYGPPHRSRVECDRWQNIGSGAMNGCPDFSAEHWRALAATGQLPPMALAGGWHL